MTSANTIDIHGHQYVTVAERVRVAHEDLKSLTITTEVLYQEPVVIKATVITPKGTFTGISAANPAKIIEKTSPYEVAETSAVGRALGFAGYGIVEGIATADEIVKASVVAQDGALKVVAPDELCLKCGKGKAVYKEGMKGNKAWAGYFCDTCGNVAWTSPKKASVPEDVTVDTKEELGF